MPNKISLEDLKSEINNIRKENPNLKDDSAFVYWFVYSYLTADEKTAKSSLTGKMGGSGGEKNLDAIYIDDKNEQCNIVQGKFHYNEGCSEKLNDVISFAKLGLKPWENKELLGSFYSGLDPDPKEKFKELVDCVKNKKYQLNLYYVTTGRCTDTIIREAKAIAREADGPVDIYIKAINDVLNIFRDYSEVIIPHIPILKLKIMPEGIVRNDGLMHRFDPNNKIESWVLSVCGSEIGKMYKKVGKNIFAKNIRGGLGETKVNESIADTIKKEPNNFWYYNNGITIVCTDVKREVRGGEDYLLIEGTQIINGQQTTITLSENDSDDTNVVVKIIRIPREHNNSGEYDKLINSIVRATNWQNYILPSDLVANDDIQICLQREMRKSNYQYIRKRMSKREARRLMGQGYLQIEKRELAQAVAACLLDPVIVRKGKEKLFETPNYESIFSSKQISFYLPKYWLMRVVQYSATGYPQRAYAKWVVLNFFWNTIRKYIDSGYSEKKFRYVCEHAFGRTWYWKDVRKAFKPLNNATISVFRAAIQFYNAKKGKGEEAKDISGFFNRINLHNDFKRFWSTRKNTHRKEFQKNINKFSKNFNALNID